MTTALLDPVDVDIGHDGGQHISGSLQEPFRAKLGLLKIFQGLLGLPDFVGLAAGHSVTAKTLENQLVTEHVELYFMEIILGSPDAAPDAFDYFHPALGAGLLNGFLVGKIVKIWWKKKS